MARTIGLSSAYGDMMDSGRVIDIDVAFTAFIQLYKTQNGVLDYLQRADNGGRGLSLETLKFYRVGMKSEKFRQADGNYAYED